MANLSIDLSGISLLDSLTPIPSGDYVVVVSNCSIRLSHAGNSCLTAEFTLMDPPFTGRRVFEYFVINEPIAMRRLKTLAVAVKYHNPDFIKDTCDLVGIRLMARVIIRKSEEFGSQNKITSFWPIPEEGKTETQLSKDTTPSQPDLPLTF